MEWLNIKEERPLPERKVLFIDEGFVCYGCYQEYQDNITALGYFENLDKYADDKWIHEVKYWMPLPKLPDERKRLEKEEKFRDFILKHTDIRDEQEINRLIAKCCHCTKD